MTFSTEVRNSALDALETSVDRDPLARTSGNVIYVISMWMYRLSQILAVIAVCMDVENRRRTLK